MNTEYKIIKKKYQVDSSIEEVLKEFVKEFADGDFNGDNYPEYTSQETLNSQFESDADYHINEIVKSGVSIAEAIEWLGNIILDSDDNYYVGGDVMAVENDGEICVMAAAITKN